MTITRSSRPAQRHGALAQRILALGALGVLEDLPHRRLPHVQVGVAAQMVGGDLQAESVDMVHLRLGRQHHVGEQAHELAIERAGGCTADVGGTDDEDDGEAGVLSSTRRPCHMPWKTIAPSASGRARPATTSARTRS